MTCVCGCPRHQYECPCGCSFFEEDDGTLVSPTPTGEAYYWAFGDEDYNGRYEGTCE